MADLKPVNREPHGHSNTRHRYDDRRGEPGKPTFIHAHLFCTFIFIMLVSYTAYIEAVGLMITPVYGLTLRVNLSRGNRPTKVWRDSSMTVSVTGKWRHLRSSRGLPACPNCLDSSPHGMCSVHEHIGTCMVNFVGDRYVYNIVIYYYNVGYSSDVYIIL